MFSREKGYWTGKGFCPSCLLIWFTLKTVDVSTVTARWMTLWVSLELEMNGPSVCFLPWTRPWKRTKNSHVIVNCFCLCVCVIIMQRLIYAWHVFRIINMQWWRQLTVSWLWSIDFFSAIYLPMNLPKRLCLWTKYRMTV